MPRLEALISSGRIVDAMLALVIIEFLALTVYRRLRTGGIPWVSLAMNLGAGASLMLALRAALVSASVPQMTFWLLASLGFHVADLALRWERRVPEGAQAALPMTGRRKR